MPSGAIRINLYRQWNFYLSNCLFVFLQHVIFRHIQDHVKSGGNMFEPYNPDRKKQYIDFEIRDALESDLAELVDMTLQREPGDTVRVKESLMSFLGDARSSLLKVAVYNGRIVGFGKARYYRGEKIEFPGWYLAGMIVLPKYRGCGIGTRLTLDRLDSIRRFADEAYYFSNAANSVSIELHEKLGFQLLQDHFEFPAVTFSDSFGQLYRIDLKRMTERE